MEISQLDKFSDNEKELFKNAIQVLMSQTYILEKRYHKEKNLYRDPLYSFMEEYESLFKEYLNFSGFNLKNDSNNGVYFIESPEFCNNLFFTKLTTIFLLLIRLLYEEKQEKINLGAFTLFNYSEILNKIDVFKLSDNLLQETKQKEALKTLCKYNFIEKVEGNYTDPGSIYVIYPSILHCIDGNAVRNILEEFKGSASEEAASDIIEEGDETDEIYN